MDEMSFEKVMPKDAVVFDREETELVTNITNKKLRDILTNSYGYSEDKLRTIFGGQKCSTKEQCEFNWALKSMKRDHNILLRDLFLYFDTFTSTDKVLTFVDDDTLAVIKNELAGLYNRKLVRNDLWKTQRT